MNIKSYFKNKEAKNAGWLITGRLVQMILSFIVSIFTARYLGPSNFGVINYAGAYVAFFTSLCTLGINSVILKDFVDNPDKQGETIGTVIFFRFLSSIFSCIMIITIVYFVDYGENITLAVVALSSVALIFQIFDTINFWFQSKYQSKVTSIATLIAYLSISIYKIILLVLGKDIRWFAFATSVDYIMLAIVLLISYRKYNGPRLSISFKKGKYLLSRSYHYIFSGMMVAIYGQVDKMMLKKMLDETTVGYYSLAFSVNLMWVFVLQAIIDSMFPTIMKLYKEDREKYLKKNRQLYSLVIYISVFVAVVLILFGKVAIKYVYGNEYIPAAAPLRIITWYTIFSYLGVARNAWIVCENKQKYLKYMYMSAVVINVVLNYIMIPKYGASGAAFASLITQISTCILLPCCIKDMRPNVHLIIDALFLRKIR